MIRHCQDVITEVSGRIGLITLNRPKALNAVSLPMVQALLDTLRAWRDDSNIVAVAIRGSNKAGQPGSPEALFGNFCAGGDIRFFHQAALQGNGDLGVFFTDEYTVNHLIHHYPKPYIAFMDGIVMGGGMGLCQGPAHPIFAKGGAADDALGHPAINSTVNSARSSPPTSATQHPARGVVRIVTENTKMAMPETAIGLFPDVGGGYFLSRCPGHVGEYLGLTGDTIGAARAVALGLADIVAAAKDLPALWQSLKHLESQEAVEHWLATNLIAGSASTVWPTGQFYSKMDAIFGLETVPEIVSALDAEDTDFARAMAKTLRQRSPLMLHVVLAQIRKARGMTLADDLRMERDMVQHCFDTRHLSRSGVSSETVEGIRALAVDKDHQPRWNPASIAQVTPAMVEPFFVSPWAANAHPLKELR